MSALITTDVDTAIIAGRPVSEYKPIREYPGHSHGNDMLVGYVVRETIRDGYQFSERKYLEALAVPRKYPKAVGLIRDEALVISRLTMS